MRVAFHTLGCKVNQNDTNNLIALFQAARYEIVPFDVPADIYVINTCAVTQVGERKSRQIIRKAVQQNPEAVVVATGCYAQTSPQTIAGIPGVNLVVGMADRLRIVELVQDFQTSHRNLVEVRPNQTVWNEDVLGAGVEKTRATLKIEEGCEQFCSYCIVPYARGPIRSMPPSQVARSVATLVQRGFKEIVLTGIHLGSYGRDCDLNLADLLKILLTIDGEFRIRLGSVDPHEITADLAQIVIEHPGRFCQSFHIPLQSGSDRILQLMNRRYSLQDYAETLRKLRSGNPLVAIGADLIVGFPTETAADFEEIVSFVTEQAFSRIHVFRYSPRQGTPAAKLPGRIVLAEQERRSRIIQAIATESGNAYAGNFVGKKVQVLFEEQSGTDWEGLSSEYLRVKVASRASLQNQLIPVEIIESVADNLRGSLD